MVGKRRKRFVIDACTARLASSSENPASVASREFLQSVLEICHRAVMSADLKPEWDKHSSSFSVTWLGTMVRRGKVAWIRKPTSPSLRKQINRSSATSRAKAIMLKDCHLVEAALACDSRIASSEKACFDAFAGIIAEVPELGPVVVVDPVEARNEIEEWLKDGAKTVRAWQLRSRKQA